MPRVGAPQDRLYGPLASGFGARIDEAAKKIGDRATAAKAMGISDDQLVRTINEASVPNFPAIAGLARAAGLSLDWLAFGAPNAEQSTRKSFSESEGDQLVIRALDGPGNYALPRYWFGTLSATTNFDTLLAFRLPNDTMEPTIGRDDLVIVDGSAKRLVDGELFAFEFGGDRVVRRTQRQPDGSIALSADNAKYDPMQLAAAELEGVIVNGQVVWVGGRV